MSSTDLLTIFGFIAGIVAVFELLEYVFTKNIPWLARLLTRLTRRLRQRWGGQTVPAGQRYLVLNFSTHPVTPRQRQALQALLVWPRLEVLEAGLGNVPEDKDFVGTVLSYVDRLALAPEQWQTVQLVVVPAGYAPAWAVLLAELHGRLGYFPDMVRLRPTLPGSEEKFELAQVVPLRAIRNQARAKR